MGQHTECPYCGGETIDVEKLYERITSLEQENQELQSELESANDAISSLTTN